MTEQRSRRCSRFRPGCRWTEVRSGSGCPGRRVHHCVGWYRAEGLDGLADRSHRPRARPAQIGPKVEAEICEAIHAELGKEVAVGHLLHGHALTVPARCQASANHPG